ncbi:hypothetical protein BD309DRAFT_888083 [Dichomitus squalens]|nr:hypothetical protein BD309DRAFT_888083 [Dichomitus squalens]
MSSPFQALSVLQDELLSCTRALENLISRNVASQTPSHHTPLIVLDDLCHLMQTTSTAMNASFSRADGKLRRFRNLHVHINALPDALLLRIFQYASAFELDEKLNLIEVCWRWRDLCLAHPQFWSEFYARHLPRYAIPRAVRYSRDHPLTVLVNPDDEIKSRKVIFANIQSIERLRVMFAIPPGQRKNAWLDKTWPMLRELDLAILNNTVDDVVPLTGRFDKLRTLTLENVRFAYSPQNYRNLRTLRIMSDYADTGHRPCGPKDGLLTDALRGSPNLEILMLKDPQASIDEVTLPREAVIQPIHLPRLRSLHLIMSTQKATLIMRHLRTSATALLSTEIQTHRWHSELGADYRTFDERPIRDIDKTLMLELPGPESFPILERLQSISIRDTDYHRVAGSLEALDGEYISWITTWNRSDASLTHLDSEDHVPKLAFNIEYKNSKGSYYDADTLTAPSFDNFARSLLRYHAPFTEIRVLRLDQVAHTYPYIRQLARAVPRVRTVVLHKCEAQAKVLKALLSGGPLPELTTLGLAKCTISKADAAQLAEISEDLRLKLVVVRIKEDDADEAWIEVERILRQGALEVEVRYMKQWVYVDDNEHGWWRRERPYA